MSTSARVPGVAGKLYKTAAFMIDSDAVVALRKVRQLTFAASRMMNHYESILAQLYEILGPYTPDGQSLSEDTEFISDLGLDSMKVMQLLLDTEERFDVSIPLNIIPDVRTVGHFARCVQQLVDRR